MDYYLENCLGTYFHEAGKWGMGCLLQAPVKTLLHILYIMTFKIRREGEDNLSQFATSALLSIQHI